MGIYWTNQTRSKIASFIDRPTFETPGEWRLYERESGHGNNPDGNISRRASSVSNPRRNGTVERFPRGFYRGETEKKEEDPVVGRTWDVLDSLKIPA